MILTFPSLVNPNAQVTIWHLFLEILSLAEIQGCLDLASLSIFSFTVYSSNIIPISNLPSLFPQVTHKKYPAPLLGLTSTPPASRPTCYHFHRPIYCLGSFGMSYRNYHPTTSLHPEHVMLLCNPRKLWMAKHLPSHKPDNTTCSLAALRLSFTSCSCTSESDLL